MSSGQFISILDEAGKEYLRINLLSPFEPAKELQASLSPNDPQKLQPLKGGKFTFQSNLDLQNLDTTPLAALALAISMNPAALVQAARILHEGFSLKKGMKKTEMPQPVVPVPHPVRQRKSCQQEYALIVEGDCSGWFGQGLILDQAANDMARKRYKIIRLNEPDRDDLLNRLADSCVTALVIVGHGTSFDSGANNEHGAMVILNRNMQILEPRDMRNLGAPNIPFRHAIIHACHQGASNNRRVWAASFGANVDFRSWSSNMNPAQGLLWQWWY